MSKRIVYTQKRLAKVDHEPAECTNKQLKSIIETYTDYLDALCSEDGHVAQYDRICIRMNPYFEEAERRGIK